MAVLDEHPEIGIVGPRLELRDGTFDHASRRSFPTPLGALGHFAGLSGLRRAPNALAQYRAPEVDCGPVDSVNGAFMLIRRRMLDEIGLFDEGYWMYMEDFDLSYRVQEAGWVTWYEPDVTVTHTKHGATGEVRSPRLTYHFHYGMFRFYRRHYASSRARTLNLAVYVGIGAKLFAALARASMKPMVVR
ncbi:MAG TPA: glycosyltransferase [Gaiellaceae bacterium]|nr:glycosyltransferase [Gaiellaceae bacterium]